jgi:hypothetical protein
MSFTHFSRPLGVLLGWDIPSRNLSVGFLHLSFVRPVLAPRAQAANDMCASCDQLIDKVSRVERFFRRLIYTSITLTTTMSMTNMIVYIYG